MTMLMEGFSRDTFEYLDSLYGEREGKSMYRLEARLTAKDLEALRERHNQRGYSSLEKKSESTPDPGGWTLVIILGVVVYFLLS